MRIDKFDHPKLKNLAYFAEFNHKETKNNMIGKVLMKKDIKQLNSYQLKVIPNLQDKEYQDIACWELFTPNHRILEVYPDFTWTAQPSDLPMNEINTSNWGHKN